MSPRKHFAFGKSLFVLWLQKTQTNNYSLKSIVVKLAGGIFALLLVELIGIILALLINESANRCHSCTIIEKAICKC